MSETTLPYEIREVPDALRYEVHRRLTSEGSRAREILDLSR